MKQRAFVSRYFAKPLRNSRRNHADYDELIKLPGVIYFHASQVAKRDSHNGKIFLPREKNNVEKQDRADRAESS